VHHNAVRGAVLDDENLRDTEDLDFRMWFSMAILRLT
jgi:hypothetical protein